MSRVIPRRPRSAFAHPPLPTRRHRKPLLSCSATPPQTDSENRVEQVRTKMETARQRVRLLNTRVIVRIAEADIRAGQTVLVEPDADAAEPPSDQQIMRRLRRDLKNLRRVADEQGVDDVASDVIARLQDVVDDVESAVRERSAARVASGDTFLRDVVEDELEGAIGVVDDLQWLGDKPEPALIERPDGKNIVGSVRRKVIERGNELRRRASNVGAGIEEKVGEFVKDDGSIDVDGLRSYVGNLLDNAGMTWKRLNGWVPKDEQGSETEAVIVSSSSLEVRDADKEFRLREEIGELEKKLIGASREREAVLRNEDQLGKLIRAKEIRQMDDGVSVLRRTLAVRVLQLEMEKIFVSLADEIENSDYEIMMDQRVLVAEFGDLDERLSTLELFIDESEPLLIEDDTLGELAADIQDLKSRLGLDEPLYSSATLNWAQLRQFFSSSARKTRAGVEFYSRGLRLFAGDVRFAMRLVRRAVTGYTPSPREIRTLRRTGKDLLTLIPFSIVLVAPLTPVGHVLVFSFLQRYWPEFFPSTFSERRQTLMKRHEQYQKLMQADAEEKEVSEGNGTPAGNDLPNKSGGPLSALRKLLFFGFMGNESAELSDSGKVLSGTESKDGDGVGVTEQGLTDESESNGVARESDLHPVALSDLADSVRDSEKVAKKKRIAVALEDLHLAD